MHRKSCSFSMHPQYFINGKFSNFNALGCVNQQPGTDEGKMWNR